VKTSRILGAMLVNDFFVTIGETFGASQRGGSVMSHIRISADSLWSPQIPRGRADLILALEPLEGVRIIQQYGSEKSQAIINLRPVYPINVIRGDCLYPSLDEIKAQISARIEKAWFFNATTLAMKEFNNPLYQNSILLGALAGLNLIPLDVSSFTQAASQVLPPHTLMENERAFELGLSLMGS
jgi:indolepyruvate ferredoxin oxidoreductase beta subunit